MNIGQCFGATRILSRFNRTHVFQRCNRVSARDVVKLALSNYKKMEKNKGDNRIDQLPRHHKYRKKTGGKLPVPNQIELQVVGTGKNGTTHGLFVNMDYFKYLFNCGEGTQRISMEQKLKLSRLEKIFITRNSWTNIGGIMGLCLTLESNNVPFINMYGPPNSDVIVTMSRSFAQLHSIQVDFTDISKETIQDEAMEITMIPLPQTLPAAEPDAKKPRLTRAFKKDMAIAYICKPKEKPRKVSIEKCVELGVPRDKKIQKLMMGESIILEESGREITPQDILSPRLAVRYFIVLECPTVNHIDTLVNCTQLTQNESPSESCSDNDKDPVPEQILDIVVHFTPKHVFEDARYQDWLKRFPEDTKHWVLNEDGSDIVFQRLYRLQAMLNLINPTIFPLLPHQTRQPQVAPEAPKNVTFGETRMTYSVRSLPAKQGQFNKENCIVLDNKEYTEEAFEQEDFKIELEILQTKLDQLTDSDIHDTRQYPEIVFLGTGSSIPNKARNVSSILVHLSPDVCMFLDAGEDTAGQLLRVYGDNTDSVLTKLKAVYISHLHADHHMGLIGLLNLRKDCLERLGQPYTPVLLLAPGNFRDWISDVDEKVFPISHLLKLIPVETLEKFDAPKDANVEKIKKDLQIQNIETCRVIHRQHPHAVQLTLADGYKLVYSGDTTPCNTLIEMGKNCDLLIHEATMEDDLKQEAAKKRHSTTSQAIDVGLQMKAGFILLTHFSQRYAKIPIFNDKFTDKVGIAFDNMRVRPCDFHLLPLFQPALKALFSEEYAEMEEKTKMRNLRKKQEEQRFQKQKEERLQGGSPSDSAKGKDKKQAKETETNKFKSKKDQFFRMDNQGNIVQIKDLPESSSSSQKTESCEKT